jgi:hypothetical protein
MNRILVSVVRILNNLPDNSKTDKSSTAGD